jgi:DNA helicase-2/ATP-dependent DNA helicase PcrA
MSVTKLNPEQAAAVGHIDGPMIVLAGPGTGKTQIIAARIARILEETQLDPHNILCLTFTESGVVAMRKRLIELTGTSAYHVRIHTFHSFCNEVIKEFPERFLFARELEALTDVERVQIFRSLIDKQSAKSPIKPFGAPYLYQKDLMNAIQQLKRENISPDDFAASLMSIKAMLNEHGAAIEAFIGIHGNSLKTEDILSIQRTLQDTPMAFDEDPNVLDKKQRTQFKNNLKKDYLDYQNHLEKQQVLTEVYRQYQKELRTRGRYDYEDMILFVVDKFQSDEALLAHYQEQFQYILVDEYQDTNGAQNQVVQLIGDFFENPNIFVVGDDKQSIYRFQGASLENILYFYNLYKKDVQLVSLKENYRSQQMILDASHSLIQNNEHSIANYLPELAQKLHANVDYELKPIQIAAFDSLDSEHYFLAKQVQSLIESGVHPSEIAILFRNNYEVEDLVDLFIRMEIPFQLVAGQNLLENTEIKQLLNLLRVVDDLDQEHILFHVLNYDFLGFEPLDVMKLVRKANKERKALIDEMLGSEVFSDFAKRCLSWKKLSLNRPLAEFFDHVVKESGFLDFVLAQADKVERLNRLNSLFNEIKKMNRSDHNLSLEAFLEHIELLEENDIAIKEHELKTQKDAVRLMTAHRSKGLEFDVVFVMHCADKRWGNNTGRKRLKLPAGLISTDHGRDKMAKNEDERRLFYVALTRAKRQVYLSYSRNNENGRPQVPSIFIEEVDDKFKLELDTEGYEDEALDRLQTVFLEVPQQDHSEEETAFVRSLLENYTMSVTHLNNYLRCPRLFYYNNLLRVPRAKTKHEAFGSAVHESLKDLALAKRNGAPLTKAQLLEAFEAHMKRQVMTEQDYRGGLEYGREQLSAYYEQYHDELSPHTLPEYDFSSHGVNLDGIPLTGKLDKIEILDESRKEVHVVDYKTGNPDTKREALGPDGEYRRQIIFYKLLCELSPKFNYTMVSGEIDFVQQSKKDGRFKKAHFEVKAEELSALKTMIKDVYKDIMNLKFLHPDEWSTCGECEYCLATIR